MGSCTSAIGSQTSEFVGRSITCTMENIKMWNSWFWEDIPHQNGYIFGKVPNGLWHPPPSFSEKQIANLCKAFGAFKSWQNAVKHSNCWKRYPEKNFLYQVYAEKALFGIFWNFSENSSVLVSDGFPNLSSHFFLVQIHTKITFQ